MEKAIVYIAKDGTQFRDEKSCLNYEETLSKCYGFTITSQFNLFDVYSEIPTFCSVEEDDIEDIDLVYTDEKGVEELSCVMSVRGLEANTICIYDYSEMRWYKLKDVIKLYEEKTKELNKLLLEIGKLIKI